MRILYCTPDFGDRPRGSAGVYLAFALGAMREAGHEPFVFTWRMAGSPDPTFAGMPASHVCAVEIDPAELARDYSAGPPETAIAHVLRPHVASCVDRWDIEVVECADQGFGAYAFFQQARTTRRHRHVVLASFMHGLNIRARAADLSFPDRATSDDLGSQRQMLRLSDVVISPSRRGAEVARGLAIETGIEIVPPPFHFAQNASSPVFSGRLAHCGPVGLGRGLDAIALLVNQISGRVGVREVYLIGEDGGTSLRTESAVDLFAARLKPVGEITLVATGALPRADALALLHASDWFCAFDQTEAFDYFALEALDRGLFPLTRLGSPLSELFPDATADALLPADLSDRSHVVACCERLLADKARRTADLARAVAERTRPAAFAARVEAIYAPLARAKASRGWAAASPSIAVLIPAHDPPEEFRGALDSLARQTRRPDRVILCDDGSSASLSPWIDHARSRGVELTVVRQRNQGLSGARNTLIDACDADLALFLDCDDELADDALERMREAWLAADRPDAVIPGRQNFGESREIVLRQFLCDHLHLLRNENRMTALIGTDALREIRFPAMRRDGEADDWNFWLAFSARGLRAEFVPDTLFRYRFVTGSMSWPWSAGQAAGTAALIAERVANAPPSERSSRLLGWSIYELHAVLHHASPR
jgi:hypothetical protein